jgi:hypothetical protein
MHRVICKELAKWRNEVSFAIGHGVTIVFSMLYGGLRRCDLDGEEI